MLPMSCDDEDRGKVVPMVLDPAILICDTVSDYVQQPLQDEAALDEIIRSNLPLPLPLPLLVTLVGEDAVELVREPIPKPGVLA